MSECRSEGPAEHRFVSRLTGAVTMVRVRCRVVDARYLETSIPATHTPSFDAEPGVHLIPVNDLVRLTGPASGYTVIGGGKTAMDACIWLLENGVPPEVIRWIRPRDAWLLDRAYQQPLDLVPWLAEGVSRYLEAAAQADDASDLFRRLEACGQLIRLDPAVEPTVYRCATVSEAELKSLRRIEDVVRHGRVVHNGGPAARLSRQGRGRGDGPVGELRGHAAAAGVAGGRGGAGPALGAQARAHASGLGAGSRVAGGRGDRGRGRRPARGGAEHGQPAPGLRAAAPALGRRARRAARA